MTTQVEALQQALTEISTNVYNWERDAIRSVADKALATVSSDAQEPDASSAGRAALIALLARIDDAHEALERYGEVCEFEGQSMIHASTLIEIIELRGKFHAAQLANRPAPAVSDAQPVACELVAAGKVVAQLMQHWLDENVCDCEGSHTCGKDERQAELERLNRALAASPAPDVRPSVPEQQKIDQYARDLAMNVWRAHYRDDSPYFGLLDTTLGVLSQLDNMVSGLARKTAPSVPVSDERIAPILRDLRDNMITVDDAIFELRPLLLASQPAVQGVSIEEMLRREIHNLKRHIEDYCQPAAPVQQEPVAAQPQDDDSEWRRLALQFDGHRMQAIWHLKAMLSDPQAHAAEASKFLAAGPLSGEEVLARRIAAIAAQSKESGSKDAKE